jgi:HTH-type transcriptional regulator/antitoxin HigA
MADDSRQYRTPNQMIEGLIKERGWNNRLLATVMGMTENGISRIVTGKQAIDAEVAITLEEVFGVPAERFLEIQQSYDLAKARISTLPDPARSMRAHLIGALPLSEMNKRGWINAPDVRDVPTIQSELMRFFGANRIEDIETLPHAAKKTEVNTPATPTQLAWLYRVRKIASEMLVAKYSPQSVASVIPKLKQLLLSAEETRKVPRIMAEAGIRFLVVETLPGAKIDGVCFWLNDRSPVIALTMRFDRIDNFWFVLRHELEHVLREHGKSGVMLDAELEGENAGTGSGIVEEERLANEAAAEFCVPKQKVDAFVARKAPFFADRDILAFAKMINVHPGLIAGQIRRKINKYDRLGDYLVKVRSSVLPNSVSDGFGSVYPVE